MYVLIVKFCKRMVMSETSDEPKIKNFKNAISY